MSLNAYDLSAGLFVRGLTNVKTQLSKAEEHVAASGRSASTLLEACLDTSEHLSDVASAAPTDLHRYTLATQIHWAAEGAKLAILRLLGDASVPAKNDAQSFEDLYRHLNATITYLREIAPNDLEAGLERTIVIEHPRGSMRSSGRQFLIAFAIPHFFYHVTTTYGILRNQGMQLTMGDFLGNWGAN